jgi:hypothetical protein
VKASMWAFLSLSNAYYKPIEEFVNTIYRIRLKR